MMSNFNTETGTEDEIMEMFVQSMNGQVNVLRIHSLLDTKCKDPRFPLDINKCAIAAAARGRADVLAKVLALNPRMSYRDAEGWRAIHHATSNGHVECARLLLKAGAISNCTDVHGRTPLHLACLMGHTDIVHLLVHQCAHINSCCTESGENAVHLTAAAGHLSVMEVLLDNGGDPGQATLQSQGGESRGESPLHKAVGGDKPQMVELLCSRGAKPDVPDTCGNFPIHLACQQGLVHCLCVLIRHGASLESRNSKNQTALGVAVVEQKIAAVEILLDQKANVFVEDDRIFSLLHNAAIRNNIDLIDLLVKAGADVNVRTESDLPSPLIAAICFNRCNAVQRLIELGADATKPDHDGNMPLHLVNYRLGGYPSRDITFALLEAGGRLDLRNRDQMTPLQCCLETGITRRITALGCTRLLCEAGSHLGRDGFEYRGVSPLYRLAYSGSLQKALYLGQAGWDLWQESWLTLPGRDSRQDRLHQMLLDIRNRTPSLLSCCRKTIRESLVTARQHREILSAIASLPVPDKLKTYLSLRDIQPEEDCVFDA